jgi:hypothetical protein
MTTGMARIIAPYFLYMRRWHVYAEITHIPGHLNDLADSLSRFEPPSCPLDPATQQKIDWRNLTI